MCAKMHYCQNQKTETLVHALVTCHLDDCNRLLTDLIASSFRCLQLVQNTAASEIQSHHDNYQDPYQEIIKKSPKTRRLSRLGH